MKRINLSPTHHHESQPEVDASSQSTLSDRRDTGPWSHVWWVLGKDMYPMATKLV